MGARRTAAVQPVAMVMEAAVRKAWKTIFIVVFPSEPRFDEEKITRRHQTGCAGAHMEEHP